MKNNVHQLPDKRKLGYALYGPDDGEPVFYFHGTPSSRLEPLIINAYNKNIDELIQQFQQFRYDDDDFFIDDGISGLLEVILLILLLFFSYFLIVLTDSFFRNHSDELIQRF